jgi:hypothetical protein
MDRMFMSDRSALMRLLNLRKLLLETGRDGATVAETDERVAELDRLIFDLRAGRIIDFVLHSDVPVHIVVTYR